MSVNYGITARIVTGLSIFTKTEILYRETGCELLSVIIQTDKISQQPENCENRNDPD
jgi:hypothetical protein